MEAREDSTGLIATLGVLRRHAGLIMLCAALAAGAALTLSLLQVKQYSATASLLFRDPGFDQPLFGTSTLALKDPEREAATNIQLVALDAVADRTAQVLNGGDGLTGSAIADKVEVETTGPADLAAITATDTDPELAAEIANAYARSYIVFRRRADRAKIADAQRLVERQIASLDPTEQASREGRSLERQISSLRTLRALQTGNAELVQAADAPEEASSPNVVQNTAFAGVLGLLIGIGLALLFERLDRRLRGAAQLEEAFSLPLLGSVPESKALAAGNGGPESLPAPESQAFKMLHARLRYFNVDRDVRSVLITSAAAEEGKSTVAWNLAATAASAGAKVILLECDFHQSTFAERRGLAPLPGLSELLTRQTDEVVQHVPVATGSDGERAEASLDVITAGVKPPNPAALMESDELAKLIRELSTRYELVVIDTPPVTIIPDAIPLLRLVSGVIVVGELQRTTREAAHALRDQLQKLEAPVLGVVANKLRKRDTYRYGYYRYGDDAREGFGLRVRSRS